MRKKVGKRRLNEIKNPIVFTILKELSIEEDNSNGLSLKLKKNQAGIYNQLIKLNKEENKYVISSNYKKNAYQINYRKIIEEFLKYLDNKFQEEINTCNYEKISIKFYPLVKNQNYILLDMIKRIFKYSLFEEELNKVDIYTNDDLPNTLEDCFNTIKHTILNANEFFLETDFLNYDFVVTTDYFDKDIKDFIKFLKYLNEIKQSSFISQELLHVSITSNIILNSFGNPIEFQEEQEKYQKEKRKEIEEEILGSKPIENKEELDELIQKGKKKYKEINKERIIKVENILKNIKDKNETENISKSKKYYEDLKEYLEHKFIRYNY